MQHPEVIFIDLEASSLHNGYPIEVGWAIVRDFKVTAESWLIRPVEEWITQDWCWSADAQNVHGIKMSNLLSLGRPVTEIKARMTSLFKGKVLFSDAVGFDFNWLIALYHADAPEGPALPFRLADVSQAFEGPGTDERKFDHEVRRRTDYVPEHRAADDALNHALMWCHSRRDIDAARFQYPELHANWKYMIG